MRPCTVVLVVATSITTSCSAAPPPPPRARVPGTMKANVGVFGERAFADGDIHILDGSIHGVSGHSLEVTESGTCTWQRIASTYPNAEGSGPSGRGSCTLTAAERQRLAAWADDAWSTVVESRHAGATPPPPPRWVWAIVVRRGTEIRVHQGGAPGGREAPAALQPALAWLVEKVDGLASAESSRAVPPMP